MQPVEIKEDLKSLREEIDQIDRSILELCQRRLEVAEKIGLLKQQAGLQVRSPEREEEVLKPYRAMDLEIIGRALIEASVRIQDQITR